MNEVVVSLGANTPDAARALAASLQLLESCGTVTRRSGTFRSEAEGRPDAPPYLNEIVMLDTAMSLDGLLRLTKDYESRARSAAHAEPLVAMDIDIVYFNGTELRPDVTATRYFSVGMDAIDNARPEKS